MKRKGTPRPTISLKQTLLVSKVLGLQEFPWKGKRKTLIPADKVHVYKYLGLDK